MLRVLLALLELVEQLDLALDQGLVAAGQVHVEVADALAEEVSLLGGHVDGHGLHSVEGPSEVGQLVVRADLDGLHGGGQEAILFLVARVAKGVDEAGQALLGQVVGGDGETAEGAGDGPGRHQGQPEGEQEASPGEGGVGGAGPAGAVAHLLGSLDALGGPGRLGIAEDDLPLGAHLEPAGQARRRECARFDDLIDEPARGRGTSLLHLGPPVDSVGGRRGGQVGRAIGQLVGSEAGQDARLVAAQLAPRGRGGHLSSLGRGGVLGPSQQRPPG